MTAVNAEGGPEFIHLVIKKRGDTRKLEDQTTVQWLWFGFFDLVNFFWYLLKSIVYGRYFHLTIICIFYFFSFMYKDILLDSPQDRNFWYKKKQYDYCGVIILRQGRRLISLLGVTFLSYGTNSWPGVHISYKMSPGRVDDWCPRGKKHAESENVGAGWLGQPPSLAAEDNKPERDLYLSQGHSWSVAEQGQEPWPPGS